MSVFYFQFNSGSFLAFFILNLVSVRWVQNKYFHSQWLLKECLYDIAVPKLVHRIGGFIISFLALVKPEWEGKMHHRLRETGAKETLEEAENSLKGWQITY